MDLNRTSSRALRARRFATIALAAGVAAAGPAASRPPYRSPAGETLFRQMVLGWCLQKLTGVTRIPNSIDPSTWPKLNPSGAENAPNLSADARINRPSRTIVDLIDRTSCFVEGGELDSAGLTARLRAEITAPPFDGELINETDTAEVRASLYSLPADKGGTAPVVMIYDYKPPAPGVATAVVQVR